MEYVYFHSDIHIYYISRVWNYGLSVIVTKVNPTAITVLG